MPKKRTEIASAILARDFKGFGVREMTGILEPIDNEPRCEVVGMLDIDGHDFCRRVHSADGVSPTIPFCGGGGQEPKIIDVEEGGAFNYSFPRSDTRRGRVQDGGAVAPALMAKNQEIGTVERVETTYRVRKLTERECWRLMGVKDEDFDKVSDGQSRSSMYHLAGDSIVTTVLMALFGEMFGVEWKDKVRGLWNDN